MSTLEDNDDVELLRRWQVGDRAAGRALYDRHAPALKRYFRRNVASGEVVELLHNTFVAAQQADFRNEGRVQALLFGIAHNLYMAHIRACARRRGIESYDDMFGATSAALAPDPEYVLNQVQEARLLMKAIRRIPLKYQLVLELTRWRELTHQQIAELLGRPAPTIGRWISEALAVLAARFDALAESQEARQTTTMTLAAWREWLERELAQFRVGARGDRPRQV